MNEIASVLLALALAFSACASHTQDPDLLPPSPAPAASPRFDFDMQAARIVVRETGRDVTWEIEAEDGAFVDMRFFPPHTLAAIAHVNPSLETLTFYDLASRKAIDAYAGNNFVWRDPNDAKSLYYVSSAPHFGDPGEKQDEVVNAAGDVLYLTPKGFFIADLRVSEDGTTLRYTEVSWSDDGPSREGQIDLSHAN